MTSTIGEEPLQTRGTLEQVPLFTYAYELFKQKHHLARESREHVVQPARDVVRSKDASADAVHLRRGGCTPGSRFISWQEVPVHGGNGTILDKNGVNPGSLQGGRGKRI